MSVNLGDMAFSEYRRVLKRAEDARLKGAFSDAAAAYRQCAELYRQYAASSTDPSIRKQRLKQSEIFLQKSRQYGSSSVSHQSVHHQEARKEAAGPADRDDYEADVLNLRQHTNIKWKDIGGLEETKNSIKAAYGMALAQKPRGVQINSWRNILLFGPPGTGKTLLAAATAGSLEADFFNIKVSNLVSKYFGETSKLISALYSVAHQRSPSVIYMDEFESLTPPRDSGDSGAERRIVSTFLSELDGLATKEDESFILTMGATNFPWLLDSAMLSRFQRRIYVPLPDEAARKSILEIHLTRRGHKTTQDINEWVKATRGFAGREIEQLCQTAIASMTQRANPGLLDLVDQGRKALSKYEIKIEPLTENDMKSALDQIHPITTADMLRQYDDWNHQSEHQM